MTDDRLDQILKQALAPDIDDKEIKVKQLGRDSDMKSRKQMGRKGLPAAAAVAAVALMTISVSAAALHWSSGLKNMFHVSDEQELAISKNNPDLVSFAMASAVDQGVTITAEQAVCAGNHMEIALKVMGLDIGDKTPDCDMPVVTLDGVEVGVSWHFDDGVTWNEDTPFYYDGTPAEKEGEEYIMRPKRADGSYELDLLLDANAGDSLSGKHIVVELHKLGAWGVPDLKHAVTGNWILDWTIQANDHIRKLDAIDVRIGDVHIKELELSPIGIVTMYDKTEIECLVDHEGEESEVIPQIAGITLNDGTVYLWLAQLSSGSMDDKRYYESYRLDRVINPDEVRSILYVDPDFDYYSLDRQPVAQDFLEVDLKGHAAVS